MRYVRIDACVEGEPTVLAIPLYLFPVYKNPETMIMTIALPKIRVGDPVQHKSLSVFPLFSDQLSRVTYRLSDEAMDDNSIDVSEVDEQGSVPDLMVENKGDTRVLFLEGEELVGAKQNRILNSSVLVAAHSKLKIPVSCVEQGRWRFQSRHFGHSGSHSPSKLRRSLRKSVSGSLKAKRGHTSDQNEIWKEVADLNAAHAVDSATAAMSDAFVNHKDMIAEFRDKLAYVDMASGIAVGIADQVVSIDLFDKPETCKKVWERLLTGVVFDALAATNSESSATPSDVERLLSKTDELEWHSATAVGEGEEFRADSEEGEHASALALEATIVHGSVLAGA